MRRFARASLLAGSALALSACGLVLGLPSSDDVKNDFGDAATGADAPNPNDGSTKPDAADAGDSSVVPDAGPCSTDLKTDVKNCGWCGHSCQGALCADGLCAPKDIVANGTLYSPQWMALNSAKKFLFFTSNGDAVWRADISQDPAVITPVLQNDANLTSIHSIAADADNVYFTNYSSTTGAVVRCANAGCATQRKNILANNTHYPDWIVTNGANFYFTLDDYDPNGLIRKCNAPDCTTVSTVGALDTVARVDTNGTDMIAVRYGGTRIYKAPLPSGTPTVLYDVLDVNDMVLDGTAVYWVTVGGSVSMGAMSGTQAVDIAPSQAEPEVIRTDSGYVYWTTYDGNKSGIYRCPKGQNCKVNPALIQQLAGGLGRIWDMRIDDQFLWVSSYSADRIWRIPK